MKQYLIILAVAFALTACGSDKSAPSTKVLPLPDVHCSLGNVPDASGKCPATDDNGTSTKP